MAERTPIEDVMRRAFDANLRYWESVGRAATTYVETVTKIWQDAPMSWKPGAMAWTPSRSPSVTPPTAHDCAALVLENVAGAQARTVLMISNDLAREAEASVLISPLRGPDGRFVSVDVAAMPETLTLAAGARVPVTLTAAITDALHEGVDYHGEVTVPGLSVTGVPIVVRRRAG
jgi:hypothetical protein